MIKCGVSVKWYRQGKTEVLREKPIPLSLHPPQIPRRLVWDQIKDCTVKGQEQTA